MSLAPPTGPPPGWYDDPWQHGSLRWWDGRAWSWQVHPPSTAPAPEAVPTLPLAAGLWGLAAITAVMLALRIGAAVVASFLPVIPAVIVVSAALYGPMTWFCVYASRRWGSGRLSTDVGARIRPIDAALGLAVVFVALQAERIALLVVNILHLPVTTNTDGLSASEHRGLYLTLAAIAVFAAPIVEELFFRGLLMSALRSRLRPVGAIVVQAVVFGSYHAAPVYGWGNIGLVVILSTVGVVLGAAAHLTRRLGAGMVGHGLLNAAVFVVLLSRS